MLAACTNRHGLLLFYFSSGEVCQLLYKRCMYNDTWATRDSTVLMVGCHLIDLHLLFTEHRSTCSHRYSALKIVSCNTAQLPKHHCFTVGGAKLLGEFFAPLLGCHGGVRYGSVPSLAPQLVISTMQWDDITILYHVSCFNRNQDRSEWYNQNGRLTQARKFFFHYRCFLNDKFR